MLIERAGKKYDQARRRIYGGVLIFAVAAGISLTAVPALRERLFDRIYILKISATGEAEPEIIIPMGVNDIPYPEEFLRQPPGPTTASRVHAESARKIIVVQSDIPSITPPVLSGTGSANYKDSKEEDDSPVFQQGETEREAYEKTLAANEKLASMIQGGNPGLSFKTWGAARRGGNIYWVRVIFQNADGVEAEYIWQADLSSGKTAPLNFNARSL
ncbi:MAG: hypothetical protein LBJ21_07585 [Acidobacteriota bacterium]|jgi:hypothetical protein|nr:hypothetical protein [Acidobacteriota bacterium]